MAFGFPPKHKEEINTSDLSKKQAFIKALETVKKLDWNIGILNENGFVAYSKFSMSSWSEIIQVVIEDGVIKINSRCTGNQWMDWGKNKKNTVSFISMFDSLITWENSEKVEEKYSELLTEFELEANNKQPLNQEEKDSNFLSIFIPSKGYFITPILMYLNNAIFIIMAITGVSIFLPDSESLLLWGANFRPVTLDGESWRLLTSCFLHIGIFHLLMNMYALVYIGLLLEPYLGKSRFLSAYLITGIAGSAASLYWNDLTISAGASGAIFGMYGVFLAMLTTNLIEKAARKAMLTSIVVFVGYNLVNGVQGGIDNAAHIGGLVSGLIVGYSFYFSLKKPKLLNLKFATIGLLSILVIASSFIVLSTTSPSEFSKYDREMEQFVRLEETALGLYRMPDNTTNQEYLDEIQNTGIPSWKSNLELIDRVDKLELPNGIHERNLKLKEYCNLRIESYELIYKAFLEDTDIYDSEIEGYNEKIEFVINDLSEQ
ncbi:MAG: rhomboid protease GluP [Crocinitomicaceae bacterium]|jgi:rhomboid protease GluP